MKSLLRNVAQSLGLYEPLGIAVARVKGIFRGIRVARDGEGNYRVSDARGRVIVINGRHAIYLSDMVVFFDFFFGAVLPDKNNEVHYEAPAWHTPPGYGRPIYFTSYAESTATLDLYQELAGIKPGDVVIDIGAYCGLTSLDFAKRAGETGRVHAFEPDPENFAALQKNLEDSRLGNVVAEEAAVWKESGTLEFQADGTSGSRVLPVSGRSDSTVRVRSVTLEEYIATHDVQRIDFIKIDAEGAEAEILASSRDVLRRFRPSLIVELHPVHDVMTTAACQKVLHEEGYETRIVSQPGTNCPLMAARVFQTNRSAPRAVAATAAVYEAKAKLSPRLRPFR